MLGQRQYSSHQIYSQISPWGDDPTEHRTTKPLPVIRLRPPCQTRALSTNRHRDTAQRATGKGWVQVLDLSYRTLQKNKNAVLTAQKHPTLVRRRPKAAPTPQVMALQVNPPQAPVRTSSEIYEEHLTLKKMLRKRKEAIRNSFRKMLMDSRRQTNSRDVLGYT